MATEQPQQARRFEETLLAALRIVQVAHEQSPEELTQLCIEEAERLTSSKISFLHFVSPSEDAIILKTWSVKTREWCRFAEPDTSYPLQMAGVWADCLRERRPLIHNDYESLPHTRGFPKGHVPVQREVVVPVFEQDKVVAILGVGNADRPYDQADVDILQLLLENTWTIIKRREAEEELRRLNQELERRVDERTAELREKNQQLDEALSHLRSAQSALVLSEQMAVLGRLVAGIMHEVNSPLAAIGSSARLAEDRLDRWPSRILEILKWLQGPHADLVERLLEACVHRGPSGITRRERRQRQDEFSERLEADGVSESHAIARLCSEARILDHWDADRWPELTPLLSDEYAVQFLTALCDIGAVRTCSENVHLSAERATCTIKALKAYIYHDPSEAMTEADLTESIETTLMLYGAPLKGVRVHREFETIAPVECRLNEIGQVWANLLHNAVQAMNERGELTIRIHSDGEHAFFAFQDTGCGISDDIASKVFEPFFTTKRPGEGSGLGLDIVHRIIDEHHGEIRFESEPGSGATFFVRLPHRQPAETPALATR